MQYGALLSNAVSYAGRLAVLALVPLFASLSRWHDVVSTATRQGFNVNLKFGFPHPIADLWVFVDAPSPDGGGVNVDLPLVVDAGFGASIAASALVALFASGLLMAGYVGSIHQYVESGRYDFLGNVADYGLRMIVFQFGVLLGAVGLLLPVLASPVLLAVVIPVLLVLAYLFYLLPYLVVVEDLPLLEAVDRSTSLAGGGGEPLVFFVVYALLVAGASVPLSLLANGGFPGVLVASVLASGYGLVLTTFTVLFVRELVGEPAAPATYSTTPTAPSGQT